MSSSQADLLALCRVEGANWSVLAREAQRPNGLARLLRGESSEDGGDALKTTRLLQQAASEHANRVAWVEDMLEQSQSEGHRLTTVLDDDYPINLRLIHNLPPFLFYVGELRADDPFSVAVVGTRSASPEGLARAGRMARGLASAGVTILSGLARGIDTAAHEACLDAGGRTVAVLGSGLRQIYPSENIDLAERIRETGALVSQFWPSSPPTSYTFPRRNIVMSGMGQGTVVIEASRTSGAKLQARNAVEHGKHVFLVKSLVSQQAWAQRYLNRPRVYEVEEISDVLRWLRPPEEQRTKVEQQQTQLALL